MDMRMKICFQVIALFIAVSGTGFAQEKPEDQPTNFVVFLADDMGWGDSATYGHPLIKTPNLDKLASQGVKFTQCYS
ncbi:MAG: sulfatase-like hydrolase/transferase, partial [Verrucomicrobiales bacterium]|nr:sulfatase-like hydrolase/transferase [Verrucomicrobiales bacterium]